MKQTTGIVAVSLVVLSLCVAPFAIAAPTKQSKIATCSAQANDKGLSEGMGDERKEFMKECLFANPVKAGGTQQNKMKSCNKEAAGKGLKGDERKKFMSACLSN